MYQGACKSSMPFVLKEMFVERRSLGQGEMQRATHGFKHRLILVSAVHPPVILRITIHGDCDCD